MLKAGSLYLVLGISLVLSVITGGVIILSLNQQRVIYRAFSNENLERNLISGLNYGLAKPELLKENLPTPIDLFGYGTDSVILKKTHWGVLEVLSCISFKGNRHLQKTSFIGIKPATASTTCLWIADLDRPISVCGNLTIKGNAKLPKAGYKPAYIEGSSYMGDNPVKGITGVSTANFPAVLNLLENTDAIFTQLKSTGNYETKSIDFLEGKDSLIQSFSKNTLIIECGDVTLANKTIQGNILIKSNGKLLVSANTHIKDAILLASVIEFERHSENSCQAFAHDSLIVNKDCTFNYPSILGVGTSEDKPVSVILNEGSSIKGLVFAYNKAGNRSLPIISLNESTIVWGRVICNGYTDLKGKVLGEVYTYKTLLKTRSAVYENHLLNTYINPDLLPKEYIHPTVFKEETGQYRLLQWIEE